MIRVSVALARGGGGGGGRILEVQMMLCKSNGSTKHERWFYIDCAALDLSTASARYQHVIGADWQLDRRTPGKGAASSSSNVQLS